MSCESRKSSGEIGDGAIKALPYGSTPQPFGVFENLQQLLIAVKTQSQFRLSRAPWTSTSGKPTRFAMPSEWQTAAMQDLSITMRLMPGWPPGELRERVKSARGEHSLRTRPINGATVNDVDAFFAPRLSECFKKLRSSKLRESDHDHAES